MKVQLKNITKKFGDFVAVDNLNLTIEDGAFHFLLGSSGSGKTTTLRMLAGLEKPTAGKLFFGDEDVTKKPAVKRGIGMVFQNYALWPHMTTFDNIAYALKLAGLDKATINTKVEEVMKITQMTRFRDRYPSELSGGQQQRVALARALVIEPRVLLFDEPLSNLDAKLRHEIRDYLIRIHQKLKITTIYVTHDRQEALSMGTQVTIMDAGKILQNGTPRNLYLNPNSKFVANFMGDTNLIKGVVEDIKDDGELVVKTDWGILNASNPIQEFKKGDQVSLFIRPESIKIDLGRQDLGGEVNVVSGNLLRTVYLGEVEKLLLQPTAGPMLTISLFNAPDYNVPQGGTVKCFFKANKVRVLPLEK